MKNYLMFMILIIVVASCNKKQVQQNIAMHNNNKNNIMETQKQAENIYQFKVTDLYGDTFDFSTLKGKKIMIVNTASECGLTPQYEGLQKLYDTYKSKNFIIIGFPANNFGKQEPGTDKEIANFCKENYGVTFPMMSKISVKGDDMHNVYQFLTQKTKNGLEDSEIAWNFQKYLLNEKGELVQVLNPKILPTDASVTSWIEEK